MGMASFFEKKDRMDSRKYTAKQSPNHNASKNRI